MTEAAILALIQAIPSVYAAIAQFKATASADSVAAVNAALAAAEADAQTTIMQAEVDLDAASKN